MDDQNSGRETEANGNGSASSSVADAMREIAQARAEVTHELDQLRDRVRVALDWRDWVCRHAALCLGSAFAIGYWIGRRR